MTPDVIAYQWVKRFLSLLSVLMKGVKRNALSLMKGVKRNDLSLMKGVKRNVLPCVNEDDNMLGWSITHYKGLLV